MWKSKGGQWTLHSANNSYYHQVPKKMLFGIYWCLTANSWLGNRGSQTPASSRSTRSTRGACQNQDVGEVRRWLQMGRKIYVRWHPDRWALSTKISDLNQILVSSLMKLSRSGEHNLKTLHVPHQAETQVDSGQALVNMASFYALWHARSIPIKKHFSGHDCNR